jgi:hypothetical protein
LLYWAPFVRWCAGRFRVDRDRLHVISRAGAPWYSDVAAHYTDLLCPGTSSRFLPPHGGDGLDEQAAREIVNRVLPDTVQSDALLHPGLMQQVFAPYWEHQISLQEVVQCLTPAPAIAPLPSPEGLPDRYIAVRCAFSPVFPETPANRAWLDELCASLTKSNCVVWLGGGAPGVDGADQREYVPNVRVHRIDDRLASETSLATQAAVIAHASAYVGTYGGLCYVASHYGVPAVSFHSSGGFFPHYRRVAEHVFGVRNARSLLVLDTRDMTLLRSLVSRDRATANV